MSSLSWPGRSELVVASISTWAVYDDDDDDDEAWQVCTVMYCGGERECMPLLPSPLHGT